MINEIKLNNINDIQNHLSNNTKNNITYDNTHNTYELIGNISYIWDDMSDNFYYIELNNETFNGNNYEINIIEVYHDESFTGLFSTNDHCIIKNIIINNNIYINPDSGCVVRQSQSNFDISNVIYNDIMNNYGNYICGNECTNFNITMCNIYGNINASNIGGICGMYCMSGNIYNSNVYGNINESGAGGICGAYCKNINIYNTTCSGNINGNDAGGIVGKYYGIDTGGTINNCLVIGNINGSGSGGITGSYCGYNGNVEIIKSLYVGIMHDNMNGAICGLNPSDTNGTINMYNSYGGNINNDIEYRVIPNIGTNPSNITYYFWNSFENQAIDMLNISEKYDELLTSLIFVMLSVVKDVIFFENNQWIFNDNNLPTLNGYITYDINCMNDEDNINYIGTIYSQNININLNGGNNIDLLITNDKSNFINVDSSSYAVINMEPHGSTFSSHIGLKMQLPVINSDIKIWYSSDSNVIEIDKNNDSTDNQYYIYDKTTGLITIYTNSFSQFLIDYQFVPCIGNDSLILMYDGKYKRIDELKRGDRIKCINEILPISYIKYTYYKSDTYCNYAIIPEGTVINNTKIFKPLLITGFHPILLNGMRIPVEFIKFKLYNNTSKTYINIDCKKQIINSSIILCDLQFDKPTYYNANGIWIQSSSPYCVYNPLPKKLYWNTNYYKENYYTTDDPSYYKEKLINYPKYTIYDSNNNVLCKYKKYK